jgi:hypothetical protein
VLERKPENIKAVLFSQEHGSSQALVVQGGTLVLFLVPGCQFNTFMKDTNVKHDILTPSLISDL